MRAQERLHGNLYFSAPKLSSTRERRIEKHSAKMLRGEGFRD